ncbi:purine-nucleoside phosphorylase [Exiguobacterium sp. 17-1]|uniref:purine-nucleoside phosphorylase n=1 Tax=Exiguobacterium TaxID=33986 RepID=UPI001FFFA4C8|nr:purine-nucleoside phosphorylase [Exiguobacterium sp. 17-1]MCK2157833.1 purine-nucleoside phosphorylase [Exiguobacterium sp. 17-1]
MTVNWNETRAYLESKMQAKPEIGLILGSGLGVLADDIENPIAIPYSDIPNFPVSTVEGHAGQLVFGTLEGKQVVAMQGRFHFYEGYSMEMVTFPVRVMKAIGVETLIVTNAAGACNEAFEPGDLMLITDHINFFGTNPLIGKNVDEMGPRFPDMSKPYDAELLRLAQETADELGITVRQGVYFGNTGPTYETPAEVKLARLLGGDVVGMSTVPEVIVARHSNMRVLGISCVSNMAAGILDQPLHHEEVMETTERVRAHFLSLVRGSIKKM